MLIALDYDRTYTLDPAFWTDFVIGARKAGHEVVCATLRHPHETIPQPFPLEVIYCGRRAKRDYCRERGLHVDVWIDDSPYHVDHDYGT